MAGTGRAPEMLSLSLSEQCLYVQVLCASPWSTVEIGVIPLPADAPVTIVITLFRLTLHGKIYFLQATYFPVQQPG